jgi:hypothetical protein
MDYLTTLERPLAALKEMIPYSLETYNEDWGYNLSKTRDAVERVEYAVYSRAHDKRTKIALTSDHCIDNTKDTDFTGELLVVKAGALMPEYRDSESQLVKCTHGNGARPDAKGRSIFCKELTSDKTVVYYRHEIEGVADAEKLPQWAKRKLAEQRAEQPAKKPKTAAKKPSLLGRLDDAKAETAAYNAGLNATPKVQRRAGMEVC